MGIDFAVNLDCPVRKVHSTEKIVELVKKRNVANHVMDLSRQNGDFRPPSEISFVRMVVRPEGPVKENVIVQTMLDEADVLYSMGNHCSDCPANILSPQFGCYGYISYPIEVATEEWLLSLLPEDPRCTAALVLQRALKDFKYDGGPLNNMRRQSQFFKSERSPRRSWTGSGFLGMLGGNPSITSSQLLQMMFCVGPVQPAHGAMLGLFLGLVPHDCAPEVLADREKFLHQCIPPTRNQTSAQIQEMIQFLFALIAGQNLGVEVYVDF